MPIIKGSISTVKVTGGVEINNRIKTAPPKPQPQPEPNVFTGEGFEQPQPQPHVEEAVPDRAELERAVNEAKEQAEIILAEARQQADAVRNEAQAMLAAAEADCAAKKENAEREAAEIKIAAREQGFAVGKAEGLKKGGDEGYREGLDRCSESLAELKKLCEDITDSRDGLIKSYEHEIFELVFAIAQKITVDSLKQKDKKVLEKMIKDASEQMRGAKHIRVTLSQLDLGVDMRTDFARLESLFPTGTTVEFEVLKDAESGTLILDNGSEIIDAGVSTQLRMIKELGLGKYRDAPSPEEREILPLQQEEEEIFEEPTEAVGILPEAVEAEAEIAEAEPEPLEMAQEKPAQETVEEPVQQESPAEKAQEKPAPKQRAASRKRKAPTNPLLSKMLGELTEE